MKKDRSKKNSRRKMTEYSAQTDPEMFRYDVDGSYTGIPSDIYYYGRNTKPVQDADDL